LKNSCIVAGSREYNEKAASIWSVPPQGSGKAIQGVSGIGFPGNLMEADGSEEHSLIVDDISTGTSELSLFPNNLLVTGFSLNSANSHSGGTVNKLSSGILDGDLKQQSISDGNGKFVRILQRPLPMMTGTQSGRYMPERMTQEAPDTSLAARPRAGHRKKTLSLNPEEREALENLVEEVL